MSIRGRLGRWWDRMADDGQLGHSSTEAQLSEPSDSSPKPSFSPRTLHKAASTTFQAFSDSLRSKAQAFYAPADHVEQNPPSPPSPSTPRKSSHRSTLWSSVRSRGSRSSRRAKISSQLETDAMLTPEQWPATPARTSHSGLWPATPTRTSHSRIGPAPKLTLVIPNLSLRDTQDDSDDLPTCPDAITAPSYPDSKPPILVSTLHSEPNQLWPSPHVHLTGEVPVKAACAAVDTHALAADDQEFRSRAKSPITSTSADTKRQNELVAAASPTDSGFREVGEAETLRSSEDTFYTADSGSNTRTSTPIASTARTSISGPPSSTDFSSLITSVKSSKDFKGTYFKGMVVPTGRATHSSKRTLASIGVHSDSQGPSLGEVELFAGSETPELPLTSCANPNTGEGAGEISQAEATHVTAEPLVSSDGTPGQIPSHSPIATMGPREVWDQSRADRKQRYDFLQSNSSYSDASTDECSDFGSELEMTPNLFRVPTVQQEANNRGDRSPGTKPIFRRSHKSTSPLKFRRKHKFRTKEPEHPLNLENIDSTTMSEPRHISNGSEPVQTNLEDHMADKQVRLDSRRPDTSDDEDSDSNGATTRGSFQGRTLPNNASRGTSNSACEVLNSFRKSSRDSPRGRRRERSPAPTNGKSIAVGPIESPINSGRDNSTTNQKAVASSSAPVERSGSRSRSPSVTPDTILQEHQYLERAYEQRKEGEANASATAEWGPPSPALRQRLADISMVERRLMLSKRERPQIVYDGERVKMLVMGTRAVATEGENDDDSEADESVKEEDDGYSAAVFNNGLEDWMAPAPIPHSGW
ncbi:MAG: hypothetical protein Q9212_006096 [Teloschistes hypoglaucus]